MKSAYLILHAVTISFPLIRSFEPKVNYAKTWKALFPAMAITAAFFISWDVLFTKAGVWGFNEDYLIGLRLFYLPIEEWLFFISVPFASVFIYECVKEFLPSLPNYIFIRSASLALAVGLVIIAILNPDKLYTFWNFIFAGSFLLFVSWKNPSWLGQFWLAYLLHLIPFFLINGILTGSLIESPIVWYNNQQNLGIRLGTIPIEDTVYALLLLLMNVLFLEFFKKKKAENKKP